MAVSQISMSDNDITGHGNHHAPKEEHHAPKVEVNKKLESQKSVGMDDLMSNLTSSNAKPAGNYKH